MEQRKIEYKEISRKMNEWNNKIKQEISESLVRNKEKIKDNYLYNLMENKYKQKMTEYEETQKTDIEKILNKRKDFYKIKVTKHEMDIHSDKVEVLKTEILLKLEKRRLLQFELIKNENIKLEQKIDVSKYYLDILKIDQEIKQRYGKIELKTYIYI